MAFSGTQWRAKKHNPHLVSLFGVEGGFPLLETQMLPNGVISDPASTLASINSPFSDPKNFSLLQPEYLGKKIHGISLPLLYSTLTSQSQNCILGERRVRGREEGSRGSPAPVWENPARILPLAQWCRVQRRLSPSFTP